MNRDMRKGFVIGMLVTAVMLCGAVVFSDAVEQSLTALYQDIKIYINGDLLVPTDAAGTVVEPFMVDGTTYLPIRAISNAFGKGVYWDDETSSIYLWDEDYGTSDPEYGEDYYDDFDPEYYGDYDFYLSEKSYFTDIFMFAGAESMLSYEMISDTNIVGAELIFDLAESEDGEIKVRVQGSAYVLRNAETYSVNTGMLEPFDAAIYGDTVVYEYYHDYEREGEPDGQLILQLLPNGNIKAEQYGDLGLGMGVSFDGEYEFLGLG